MRRTYRLPGPSAMSGMVSLWGQSSLIESVQYGSFTISNGNLTATATITEVDTTRSTLDFLGSSSTDTTGSPGRGLPSIILTNGTTITGTRTLTTGDAVVAFCVVQYRPGVLKSVQRGTLFFNVSPTTTATVTEVNTAKTQVVDTGVRADTNGFQNALHANRLTLTNGTTITGTLAYATPSSYFGYEAREFY